MEAVDGHFLTHPGFRARRNFSARVLTRTTKGLLMLVLMRGKSQVVVVEIGGLKMELTVLDVRGDKVKLGFKAPAEFAIDRKELADKIKKENVAASKLTPGDIEGLEETPRFPRPA